MAHFSISPIKAGPLSFLVLDSPSDETLPAYIPVFEQHNVTDLVRVCEGSPYDIRPLTAIGIQVHDDMKFEDGTTPSSEIVARWLKLNDEVFFESPTPGRCIAVHCMSGIGRAPVLVAVSLIENDMDPLDAIAYIRKERRGAFNSAQIAFLDGYKKRRKGLLHKKPLKRHDGGNTASTAPVQHRQRPHQSLAPQVGSGRTSELPRSAFVANGDGEKKGFFSRLFGKH